MFDVELRPFLMWILLAQTESWFETFAKFCVFSCCLVVVELHWRLRLHPLQLPLQLQLQLMTCCLHHPPHPRSQPHHEAQPQTDSSKRQVLQKMPAKGERAVWRCCVVRPLATLPHPETRNQDTEVHQRKKEMRGRYSSGDIKLSSPRFTSEGGYSVSHHHLLGTYGSIFVPSLCDTSANTFFMAVSMAVGLISPVYAKLDSEVPAQPSSQSKPSQKPMAKPPLRTRIKARATCSSAGASIWTVARQTN